ncbi:TlpA family protein disulfide reductase [Sphingobacterium phlebotomi]|nr:TlpA disulfide reductase family protein [Sphingobacterium phlebotomi]
MMHIKKLLLLFCLLMGAGITYAAKGKTTITGKITGFKGGVVSLSYQAYTVLSTMEKQELEVGPDGEFRFDIDISAPVRAFFMFGSTPVEEKFTLTKGDGKDTTMTTGTNRPEMVYLYLKPKGKQHVEVTMGDIQKTLQITGKNHADSYYLNQEDWQFNQYRDKHLKNYFAYVHYDPLRYQAYVEERKSERSRFLEQYTHEHKVSKHLRHVSEWNIYTDAIMARLLYPSMRRNYRQDGYQADTVYYSFLDSVKVNTTRADKGIAYFYFLDYFLKESHRLSGSEKDYIDYVTEKLSDRPLYEYYAFALQSNFKRKLYDKFGSASPYRDLAKKVKEKFKDMEGMLEGNPAPLLTMQDTSGNAFTWKDWKGKYIYIDLWATWCGPCIQEIPSLQLLEHDYADRNIVFVSISVDREKDKQKWINFVREEQLGGIQVWVDADNHKRISQAFQIQQIPRFIVLDDKGQIVDANAPRPSDKRIRTMLNKLLR